MKRLSILTIALIMIFGCQQEAVTGYVGQQFLLKADVPDEVGTFDYIWKITDLPESSELTLSDIQFSEDESQAIFIPDVVGHYTLQVTVWKYNDKLGAIAYTYDILNSDSETASNLNENDAWLNESVEETNTPINEMLVDEQKADDSGEKVSDVVDKTPKVATQLSELANNKANFTIQIAAESDHESAKQAVDKYKMAGFDAYIQEITTASNKTMYRIRIGKYTTREEADQDAQRIELEYGLDPWITKY